MTVVEQIRTLLERARFDLEHGWVEAALDCLDRAMRLLRDLEVA
ncbi:MAG: hypothetical protein M0038_09145 [Pseudomonadota bacterium]|jgi:hypothetical protein|nr:hypothetical protein [Pseudomonadota bacterium]